MKLNVNLKNTNGFSLVELLVVIAIVALIAGIAVPSYREQAMRGKRVDGKAFIMDIVARQERYYVQNATYATSITNANGLNMSDESEKGYYSANANMNLTPAGCGIDTDPFVPCTGFNITAAPNYTDSDCGSLSLNNKGEKAALNGAATDEQIEQCWR